MGKRDKRVDAYVATKAGSFAPILSHVRELVHKACPDVEETIKWGMPSFDYKGPYFSYAAFKQHCVFGFWKAKLLKDPKNYLGARKVDGGSAMGHFGRVTQLSDLPPDKVILDFLKQAKKLNDEGIKVPPKRKISPRPLKAPADLMDALKKNRRALSTFDAFSPSNKRDYVEWITEAKTEATREKRIVQAVEWMAEGKPRNWKYMRK